LEREYTEKSINEDLQKFHTQSGTEKLFYQFRDTDVSDSDDEKDERKTEEDDKVEEIKSKLQNFQIRNK
jgi:hypothetical protein